MKVCSRCHIEKGIDNFKPLKTTKDGLHTWCNDCAKEYRRQFQIARRNLKSPKKILEKKICTNCKTEKTVSEFRIRSKKYKGNPQFYINSTCKQCEKDLAGQYYHKKNTDPNFLKKHAERAKKWYNENKDVIKQRAKVYRSKETAKENRKKYIAKNKIKISEQEKLTKKKYHEKHRDTVSDSYAIRQLVAQGYGTYEDILANKDLIELEKVKILTKRIRVKIINIKRGNENNNTSSSTSV